MCNIYYVSRIFLPTSSKWKGKRRVIAYGSVTRYGPQSELASATWQKENRTSNSTWNSRWGENVKQTERILEIPGRSEAMLLEDYERAGLDSIIHEAVERICFWVNVVLRSYMFFTWSRGVKLLCNKEKPKRGIILRSKGVTLREKKNFFLNFKKKLEAIVKMQYREHDATK